MTTLGAMDIFGISHKERNNIYIIRCIFSILLLILSSPVRKNYYGSLTEIAMVMRKKQLAEIPLTLRQEVFITDQFAKIKSVFAREAWTHWTVKAAR